MYNGYLQIIEHMAMEILKAIGVLILLVVLFYYIMNSNDDNNVHPGLN